MASKIVITFATDNGDKNFTYNHASTEATSTQVKTFITAMITNGSIFQNVPLSAKAAKIVTTTENEYDLS